jgi:hypothetical protein
MTLIRRDGAMIPGGYPYTCPRTGMKFDGFDAGGFGDQVLRIVKFRQTNKHLFHEPEWTNADFVGNQLDEYQCLRLGNDPRFCYDGTLPPVTILKASVSSRTCPICNVNLLEKLCSTCGGRKITGYTCPECGKTFPL